MNENEKLIKSIIEAIQEKKGRDIVHVDLTGIETAAAQGFVIATGNTPMQVTAVADSGQRQGICRETCRATPLQLRWLSKCTVDYHRLW